MIHSDLRPPRHTARKSLRRPRRAAMALVVTLALLVLVTIASMAFFARATANRTIESSRANQVLSKQLSETAQDYVIGRFLQEMTNNAQAFEVSGMTVYQVTNSTGMVPQKQLAPGISASDATNTFANLVRQSVSTADTNASTHSSSDPSQNGRMISANRWNAPMLNTASGFSSTSQLPNWIYVNRDGNATATPSTNAIGRFAYNVYETGGLLDANVAGHPGLTGASLQAIKGTLAGADLTALPGISTTARDELITFRNPQATTPAAYTNYVAGAARGGFLSPLVTNGSGGGVTTNNFFASRQDLLRYAKTQNQALTNALPYLTHASRNSSAPSWGPQTNAGTVDGVSYNYQNDSNKPASTNRFFPSVLVKAPFTRRDGSQAKAGESLIKSKFPLSKLAWIGKDGSVAPGTAATIQRDFGLAWDNANKQWNYFGHAGNTVQTAIKTLDQVATDNREPNFFELLKAGILSGSLGQGPADNNGTIGMFWNPAYSRSVNNASRQSRLGDYQIMQIGANIVDQQDSDSIPTAISFDPSLPAPIVGVENLPLVYKLFTRIYRPEANFNLGGDTQPAYRPYIRGWFVPEIWNPHQNATSSPSLNMRIIQTAGNMRIFTKDRKNAAGDNITGASPYAGGTRFSVPAATGGQTLSFSAGSTFASPQVLSGNRSSAAEGNFNNGSGFNWSGFWVGDIKDPDGAIAGTTAAMLTELAGIPGFDPLQVADWITARTKYGAGPYFDSNVVLEMQVDAGGGDWRTVQRLVGPNAQSGGQSFYFFDWQGLDLTETDRTTATSGSHALVFSDPRTQRFGMGSMDNLFQTRISGTRFLGPLRAPTCLDRNNANPFVKGRFLRVTGAVPYADPADNEWTEQPFSLAALGENLSASIGRVPDVDSILRPGDGRLATAAGFDDQSDGANATKARPVILDRPFRSVGELATVFRDQPWKTLDFFSAESADSALLDLFSVEDCTTSLQAGKVNLNTARTEVLQALLTGANTDLAANFPLSSTEAATLAGGFRTAVSSATLISPGDLADATSRMNNAAFPSTEAATIKSRRELLARALAPVGQTRAWNLLIDVIVQSGRFPPSGSVGAGNFIVEAESRVWTSCALDRFTATVTSSQHENISE